MKQNIRVYDIDYLYLKDEKYARGYNEDFELTEDEIKERIEYLKNNREVIFKFEEWGVENIDEEDWNDEEIMEDVLVDWVESMTGEYFTGYSWEYLVESN
jgi:hypothetical protein